MVKVFALNDIQHGTVQFSFPFALANPANPAPIPFTTQPGGASGVFTFQWFFKNGENEVPTTPSTAGWTAIPGATSSTFDPEEGLSVTRTFACFTTPVPLCAGFTGNWASNKCVIVIR